MGTDRDRCMFCRDDCSVSRSEEHLWAVSVGWHLCPECGETPAEARRPGGWERFRYWLVNGSKTPTTLVCANGHEWERSIGMILFRRSPPVPRWVRLPGELFRTLLAERRMQPTPMTYLLAAGTGLLLGLILDLALGWPWWAVATGFVVFVWLMFLSSAFHGPDLGHRLLRVLDPVRAAERDRQRLEGALASGSLIGYEVESWDGAKSIGGWSSSPEPHSLTIRHGEYEQAEWIEVTTQADDEATPAGHWIQEDLERRLIEAQFPFPDDPTIEDLQQRQRNIQQAKPPEWQTTSFRVDHQDMPGQIARVGSHWAALIAARNVVIEMTGSRVNPNDVQLVRIATLAHYPRSGT